MKTPIPFILFSLFFSFCSAQNLVPNPSFEDFITCPYTWDQVDYALGWYAALNSPDYFNSCSLNEPISPPFTGFGNQLPHTGSAHIGFSTFDNTVPNYREVVTTTLDSSLEQGKKYFFSCFVNLGGAYTLAANKISVKLSTLPLPNDDSMINNIANLYWDQVVIDSTNWVNLSGSFVSDSSYKYLSIGNFFDDQRTSTFDGGHINTNAYYFLDDVCLSTDSVFVSNWTGIVQLKQNISVQIYPNPVSDFLTVLSDDGVMEIIITDANGKVVLLKTYYPLIHQSIVNVNELPSASYLVAIKTTNHIYQIHFVIVHHL